MLSCGGCCLAMLSRSLEAPPRQSGTWVLDPILARTHTPPGQLCWDPEHFLFEVHPLVFPLLLTKKERVVGDLGSDSPPPAGDHLLPGSAVQVGCRSRGLEVPRCQGTCHLSHIWQVQMGKQNEHWTAALLWGPRPQAAPCFLVPCTYCLASAQPGARHHLR